MSAITRKDVRELAWLLRMETRPTESMGALFERVRARAAQLVRLVDGCASCGLEASLGPTLDDRRLSASVAELPDTNVMRSTGIAPSRCAECSTRTEHVEHVRRLMGR